MIDPVTLEVLRHRLQMINEEQSLVAIRTSGSPIVYEAYDTNSSLLTPSGDALCIGPYAMRLSLCLDVATKYIIDRFSTSPGINDGDVFYTNDPWAGAAHQNDSLMVAPIFWRGEIVAWSGISMHEMDVGGPAAAGYGALAKDVYGESPLIPPVKVVEGGQVRPDVEALVLRNTRTPAFNGLNIRARLAAINRARMRIGEIIGRYGRDTLLEAQQRILDVAQQSLVSRLLELPDGIWRQEGFLDYDRLYRVRLMMAKERDRLVFDFRGTSKQAPAMVNATRWTLESGVMAALLTVLCYDMPWAPAAFRRNLEVISEEGTLVHARFPAGVGQGPTATPYLAGNLVCTALAKLFASTETYREEIQANWCPSTKRAVVGGLDQRGEVFATTLIDQAGGAGARSYRDGTNSAHMMGAPMMAIGNAEVYERLFPILYLYRKHASDSGGPGKYRGGLGTEVAMTMHKGRGPMHLLNLAGASSHLEAKGVYGGLPSSVQPTLIVRGCNPLERLRAGHLPRRYQELAGRRTQVLKSRQVTQLRRGDLYVSVQTGGAGYGDPLERDPALVQLDVAWGACSPEVRREVYGVVLDPATGAVLAAETDAQRERLRRQRLAESQPADGDGSVGPVPSATGAVAMRLGDALEVVAARDGAVYRCARCWGAMGAADRDPKYYAWTRDVNIAVLSPWNRLGWVDDFVLREFVCPACGHLWEAQPRRKGDPSVYDTFSALQSRPEAQAVPLGGRPARQRGLAHAGA